jgi:hypothetical protein
MGNYFKYREMRIRRRGTKGSQVQEQNSMKICSRYKITRIRLIRVRRSS